MDASGEFTTVTLTSPGSGAATTFTWSYSFQQSGGHALSNIAIRFCSSDILGHVTSASPSGEVFASGDVPGGHTGFGPGIKFGTTAATGALSVTFDQAYEAGANGVFVQSHSGDGQVGDAITSGHGPAPAACDPGTTTTLDPDTTVDPGTTTTVPPTTTTQPTTTRPPPPPTTTTVPAPSTTRAPATSTTTRGGGGTGSPGTTTTTPTTAVHVSPTNIVSDATTTLDPGDPAETATTIGVLAVTQANDPGGRLASTGGQMILLIALGAVLTAVGLALLVGEYVGRPAGE